MKFYKVVFETMGETLVLKTDATVEQVDQAIAFISDDNTDNLLKALRVLGCRASYVNLDTEQTFHV